MLKVRGGTESCNSDVEIKLITLFLFSPLGSATGFKPSTKSFLFTLQSFSSPPLGQKWLVNSSERFRAIFRAPGRLQFGEDLLLNLTDRSVFTDIGHVYNITDASRLGSLPCGASNSVVEVNDVEVLSPFGKCVTLMAASERSIGFEDQLVLNSGFCCMKRLGVSLPSPPPLIRCYSIAGYSLAFCCPKNSLHGTHLCVERSTMRVDVSFLRTQRLDPARVQRTNY